MVKDDAVEQFYAKDRRVWRLWLSKHHRRGEPVWLVYYKKDSGTPSITYAEAVESEHPRTRLGRRDVGPQVALFAPSRAEPEIDVELAAPEGERWIVQTESFCDARERVYLQLADATPAEAQRGDRCAQGVGEMGQGCGSAHSRFR